MLLAPLALLFLIQPKPVPAPKTPAKEAASAPVADSSPTWSDEKLLKSVGLASSVPALLDFFRQRTARNADPLHLAQLTQQLSDKKEAVFNKASAELVGVGAPALPALRRALNQADDEDTARRARSCLEAIEGNGGSNLVQSAVRLLADRKPESAAAALLAFLPWADDDLVQQEIETALLAVGLRGGQPEPALRSALTDASPIRRRVAARVLCQIGGSAGRAAVRPLLQDAKPSVRMQAALSLADAQEADAVPVLIELVAELPPEGRKQVEAYLADLAGEWAVRAPQAGDALSGRLRRETWTAWWRTLDGKQLLQEFRGRTLSDAERAVALERIARLDAPSADVRLRAAEELIGMGPRVASLLRQTLHQGNANLADPVRQCLESLERGEARPMPEAAARLLALRRPEGALDALLAFLPFAENESLSTQIIHLLASLGCSEGKADPVLVRALSDKLSVRRSAAAVSLCKGGAVDAMPAVRKLLNDADAEVRLRTALALLPSGDKSVVPTLIAVLADLPLDDVWEVEDVLLQLAGEKAPKIHLGADKASRTAYVEAWKGWWKKEEKTVDLAQLTELKQSNGLLLAIEPQAGRIVEMTRRGQVRWQMQGLQYPMDAVTCPNGNVLVLHQSGTWLSMRTRQGKELWQTGCNQAFHCQRLRNGHFFVAGHQAFMEYDAQGKEVSSLPFNSAWIVGATRYPNGQIGLFTQQGQYVRLDAAGKQLKTYQVTFQGGGVAMTAEVLPGDRVVASLNVGRVAEYDGEGKEVWNATVMNPAFPYRLPNGHTLVAQNGVAHLYELDRKGKIISEKKDLECSPYRIRRR